MPAATIAIVAWSCPWRSRSQTPAPSIPPAPTNAISTRIVSPIQPRSTARATRNAIPSRNATPPASPRSRRPSSSSSGELPPRRQVEEWSRSHRRRGRARPAGPGRSAPIRRGPPTRAPRSAPPRHGAPARGCPHGRSWVRGPHRPPGRVVGAVPPDRAEHGAERGRPPERTASRGRDFLGVERVADRLQRPPRRAPAAERVRRRQGRRRGGGRDGARLRPGGRPTRAAPAARARAASRPRRSRERPRGAFPRSSRGRRRGRARRYVFKSRSDASRTSCARWSSEYVSRSRRETTTPSAAPAVRGRGPRAPLRARPDACCVPSGRPPRRRRGSSHADRTRRESAPAARLARAGSSAARAGPP